VARYTCVKKDGGSFHVVWLLKVQMCTLSAVEQVNKCNCFCSSIFRLVSSNNRFVEHIYNAKMLFVFMRKDDENGGFVRNSRIDYFLGYQHLLNVRCVDI
jgi:hypothetical protein